MAFSQRKIIIPHYSQIITPFTLKTMGFVYLSKDYKTALWGGRRSDSSLYSSPCQQLPPFEAMHDEKGLGWASLPDEPATASLGARQIPRAASSHLRVPWTSLPPAFLRVPDCCGHQKLPQGRKGTWSGRSKSWAFPSSRIEAETFFSLVQNKNVNLYSQFLKPFVVSKQI